VLDLNTDTVRFIVERSREFQFEEEEGEGADVADDQPGGANATVRAELESAIADLEPDQQIELVALMWLGRGDYELDEWENAKRDAAAAYNGRTASYLIGTPLLGDYLEEGLVLHGHGEA